jgi:hypothetical protein
VSSGCNMLSLIIVAISAKIDIEHDSTFCMDRRSSVQSSLIRLVKPSSDLSAILGTGGTARNLAECSAAIYFTE